MLGLAAAVAQTIALAVAAAATGSAALITQTATNLADVAVGVFLLVAVVRSSRPADDDHPLGYGRERFFWSFVAAVGIFIGGVGAAVVETLETIRNPGAGAHYPVGYAVLFVVFFLDGIALLGGLHPLTLRARQRQVSVAVLLWRGTDPAVTTVVLSSAAGMAGGLVAAAGLVGQEITGSDRYEAVASALIGVILLATSVVLLNTNRELLTGRGVGPTQTERMRQVVAGREGVVGVPDIFGLVVGPAIVIVDADVIFEDSLDVSAVESVIVGAAAALRQTWPTISYIYLNPVAAHRTRRRRETNSSKY